MDMSTINDRIKKIVDELFNGNVSAFARKINIPQPTLKDIVGGKLSTPRADILEKIFGDESLNVSAEWLLSGKGEMLKNISENSQNLSKQSIPKERNNSIDEFINQKIEKTVMENIPAIISAVMEGMNKQMEGQNQVINKQLDMLQEVIRSLADLNNKSDKIHDNILKISRKAQ